LETEIFGRGLDRSTARTGRMSRHSDVKSLETVYNITI
jgi:hypothetical protein